ncbi:MAG: bifunctional methylenetetrahydrofolate dehydrogenase/methenyltetrahydrofolate cyclohydrolase FolD [Ignavibacteriales bacterium]|nr:MAG: bifunctional methylenetetrahydrofolate dehydrogenase/methenyltetrahydrofolate cyclohydrolase FolD [Ignavibacteriales bacterium]
MIILDGKETAKQIRKELAGKIAAEKQQSGKVPGIAVILVGSDAASEIYVNSKAKACLEIGMKSVVEKRDASLSQSELLALIEKYNHDETIHGILVQLPLPKGLNEQDVISAISPDKDVDGFHPVNTGKLVNGEDTLVPCTPAGIHELLLRYKIPTSGKHAVVVGRSNIVGKPIANILMQKKEGANCAVTVVHSAVKNIADYTRSADILIAAIGKADFITGDMVKEGACVIDVGINRVEDASLPKGYKVTGDVKYDEVSAKASYITPVPGGVGPMTIAMLLSNTWKAFSKEIVS